MTVDWLEKGLGGVAVIATICLIVVCLFLAWIIVSGIYGADVYDWERQGDL
jgi:hypothetical protein